MENQINLLTVQVKERCALIKQLSERVSSINLMFSDYQKFKIEYAKEEMLENADNI
jgi:hypothetical protein